MSYPALDCPACEGIGTMYAYGYHYVYDSYDIYGNPPTIVHVPIYYYKCDKCGYYTEFDLSDAGRSGQSSGLISHLEGGPTPPPAIKSGCESERIPSPWTENGEAGEYPGSDHLSDSIVQPLTTHPATSTKGDTMTKQIDKAFDTSIAIYVRDEIIDGTRNKLWLIYNSADDNDLESKIRGDMAMQLLQFMDETEKRAVDNI